MTGTLVNTIAIAVGGAVGALAGRRIGERFKTILTQALGLAVLVAGGRMALAGKSELLAVGCLLAGGLVGELLRLEERVARLGETLKNRFASDSATFVEGFVTASVLFCTGAFAILGSLRDGSLGDPSILLVKSLMDLTASMVMASAMGVGVAFSAVCVLAYQGSLTLLAGQLAFLSVPRVIDALSTTGGVIVVGIGLNLLGVTRIRIGNLLPSLFIAAAGAWWFVS